MTILDAIWSLFKAVTGMALVLGAWFVIQAFVRFGTRCDKDRDLLDYLLNGCGGCSGHSCSDRKS